MKKIFWFLIGLIIGAGIAIGLNALAGTIGGIRVNQGGTGNITVNHGSLLFGSTTFQSLVELPTSTTGSVLWMANNVPAWTATSSLGITGGSGNSAWTIGSGLIYNATSTDKVGIGTTAPTSTLFVQGKAAISPFTIASSNGDTILHVLPNKHVAIGTTTPTDFNIFSVANGSIAIDGAGGWSYCLDWECLVSFTYFNNIMTLDSSSAPNSEVTFLSSYGEVLRLDKDGQAGINTSTPNETLSVQGNGATNPFRITSSTGAVLLTVNANGNVGIATTTPSYPLVVVGDAEITNILHVPNVEIAAGGGFDLLGGPGSSNASFYSDAVDTFSMAGLSGSATFDFSAIGGDFTYIFPGANGTLCLTTTCVSNAYASSTFPSFTYASSTFPSFTYSSSTFPSFTYATNTFQTILTLPLAIAQGGTATTSAPTVAGQLLGSHGSTWGVLNLVAGSNITLTTSTPGQITIAATGGAGNSAWTIGTGLIYNATSTDEVGVGTATPTSTFHIQGNGTTPLLTVSSSTGSTMFQIGVNASATIASLTASACDVKSTTGGQLYCGTDAQGAGGAGAFNIGDGFIYNATSTDEVGIGTSTPDYTLTIQGNGAINPFRIASSTGAVLLTVNANGNVGIGTDTPNNIIQVFDLIDFNNTVFNTKLGYQAGKNIASTTIKSVYIGYQAGAASSTASVLSNANVGVGYQTLFNNTSGYYNTAVGESALYNITSGYMNTAVGRQALYDVTSGYQNTAIGHLALSNLTTGFENIAIGRDAMAGGAVTGDNNTAIGKDSLFSLTSGDENVAIGYKPLNVNTTGNANIAIGALPLESFNVTNDSNTYNIAIGYRAGLGIATGTGNLILGSNIGSLPANLTNNIILADGEGNQRIRVIDTGQTGIGSTTPTAKLVVQGTSGSTTPVLIVSSSTGTSLFQVKSNGSTTLSSLGSGVIVGVSGELNTLAQGTYYQVLRSSGTGVPAFADIGSLLTAGSNISITGTSTIAVSSAPSFTTLTVTGTSSLATTAGRVGVGTTTPTAKFEIQGLAGNIDLLNVASSSGTSVLRVTQAGKVGIGSTTPTGKLTVVGTSGLTDNILVVASSTNTHILTVTSAGKVGINSSSPASTLTIEGGQSNATTTIMFDSSSASRGTCLVLKDADGSGFTYVIANNGTLTASTNDCR